QKSPRWRRSERPTTSGYRLVPHTSCHRALPERWRQTIPDSRWLRSAICCWHGCSRCLHRLFLQHFCSGYSATCSRHTDAKVTMGRLLSAYGEAIDTNGGRSHASTKFQVAADFRDVLEDVFQVSRDRDFFDRVSKLSVDNPLAGCATRVIARDEVRTHAK